jgi:hypothetical protein
MIRIPAREWNSLSDHVRRHGVLYPGENCRITRHADGIRLTPDHRAFRWAHPWQVTAYWDTKQNHWRARMKAGFLDGEDPILAGGTSPDIEPDADVPLLARDATFLLPIALWQIKPPAYFARLGVRDPLEGFQAGGSTGVQIVDESWRDEFRRPPRQLARADIVLSKARAALSGEVSQAAVGSGFDVLYTPAYNTSLLDQRGARGRIYSTPIFEPPKKPGLIERLLGDYTEPQEDLLHIATVWLLSPAGDTESPIGPSWEPYYQHHCFWNLAHAAPLPEIPRTPRPITLATGLAGGIADAAFQSILAPGNDAAANITAALTAVSPEGKFYSV